jgi:PPOX class probable F420-dependent enzyme
MTALTPGARAFLAQGMFAHVITVNPDGSPHVSLAWAGLDGDDIVWATFSDQHKIENLRRDPRISLSFQARESGGEVLHPYLVVRGRATISEGGALAVMDHLAPIYLGPGSVFPMRAMPSGITVRVEVDKVYGQGAWRKDAAGA